MEDVNKYAQGAGFVLVRKETGLMLVLLKEDGQYDIPKGVQEKGESTLACAIRECFEECSILVQKKDVAKTSVTNGYLTVFFAYTEGIPQILPNEHTGIIEHAGFKWVTFDEAIQGALDYLKPLIDEIKFVK
tara:strand:+ start:12380 stop:12775 length:396 start_codon:yes stop_codon:yes gene_type:complete